MAFLSDFLHHVHARRGEWLMVELAPLTTLMPAAFTDVQFYVALRGNLIVKVPGGHRIELRPADVGMVFGGTKHYVEAAEGGTRLPFDHLKITHNRDIPPLIKVGKGPNASKFLAGRVSISWPVSLHPSGLPSCLNMRMASCTSGKNEVLLSFEQAALGAGANAYLTKLAELLLLRTLRENIGLLRYLPLDEVSLKLTRALRLIDGNPGENWSVARLAREVGMSRSSFAHKFVGHTGKRPIEFLTEHRLSTAAEMLAQELASVAEVAHRVGYRSEAAFSRRFVRQYGSTPGRFRKISRESRRTVSIQTTSRKTSLPGLPA